MQKPHEILDACKYIDKIPLLNNMSSIVVMINKHSVISITCLHTHTYIHKIHTYIRVMLCPF